MAERVLLRSILQAPSCGCLPALNALRRPSLPSVSETTLHTSLAKLGYDEEDALEVLCSPLIKTEHLKLRLDELPAALKEDLVNRLVAFDEEPEVEAAPEALKVFAYGTLRGDFSLQGDKWGILALSGASWEPAFVQGYRLRQDPRLTYPFAVHTGVAADIIVGTVISWPSEQVARKDIANCNQVEGYRPSQPQAGLYRRSLVEAMPIKPGPVMKALIYHQTVWPEDLLKAAWEFPNGDWLAR
ncbi:unnamed protein product [Effrenium voratum]|nr:unnamed protein product [Effrenium voratum]